MSKFLSVNLNLGLSLLGLIGGLCVWSPISLVSIFFGSSLEVGLAPARRNGRFLPTPSVFVMARTKPAGSTEALLTDINISGTRLRMQLFAGCALESDVVESDTGFSSSER